MYYRRRTVNLKVAGILIALCVVFSSALGFTGGLVAGRMGAESNPQVSEPGTTSADLAAVIKTANSADGQDSGDLPITEIAALTANSVVEITTETVTTGRFMGQYVSEGAGSGVIVTSDGYIVTNNHVVEGASKIGVRLKNGETYTATLVGTDEKTDIAVVKISATGLQPAVFGDSDKLQVGQLAVAIGNPLGQLGGTVTDGIISALDREIDLGDETMNLLQTNAAINPGNSGGGLFNGQGELIGIVNAKSSGSDIEGLGFAIPINDVKTVISDLVKYGYVQGRIDLGMSFVNILDAQTAMMYRVQSTGLYIKSVTQGSNAESAGFKAGDRVVSVNGNEISSLSDLNKVVDGLTVGQTVSISVSRSERALTLQLKLAQYKS